MRDTDQKLVDVREQMRSSELFSPAVIAPLDTLRASVHEKPRARGICGPTMTSPLASWSSCCSGVHHLERNDQHAAIRRNERVVPTIGPLKKSMDSVG
jgi:hypothetical protein